MKNLFLIIMLFSTQFAFAQSEFSEADLNYRNISNLMQGNGYIRAIIPNIFETKIVQKELCLLADNEHLLVNLEVGKDYEIRLEIVEVKPEYRVYKVEPPHFYKNRNLKIHISERSWENIDSLRSEWQIGDTIIYTKTIKPAYTQYLPFFKYRGKYNVCLSTNPESAIVWTYERFRAVKIRQQKVIHLTDNQFQLETLPDTVRYGYSNYEFDTVYQLVKTIVPADIDTFKIIHFYNDTIKKNVTTINLKIHKLIYKTHLSKWQKIICSSCAPQGILRIQQALEDRGYKVKINNIFDRQTKSALVQFQKDNFLPIGYLDKETLKLLNY